MHTHAQGAPHRRTRPAYLRTPPQRFPSLGRSPRWGPACCAPFSTRTGSQRTLHNNSKGSSAERAGEAQTGCPAHATRTLLLRCIIVAHRVHGTHCGACDARGGAQRARGNALGSVGQARDELRLGLCCVAGWWNQQADHGNHQQCGACTHGRCEPEATAASGQRPRWRPAAQSEANRHVGEFGLGLAAVRQKCRRSLDRRASPMRKVPRLRRWFHVVECRCVSRVAFRTGCRRLPSGGEGAAPQAEQSARTSCAASWRLILHTVRGTPHDGASKCLSRTAARVCAALTRRRQLLHQT